MDTREDGTWLTPPEAKYIEGLIRNALKDEELALALRTQRYHWAGQADLTFTPGLQNTDAGGDSEFRAALAEVAWKNQGTDQECICIGLTNDQLKAIGKKAVMDAALAHSDIVNFDRYQEEMRILSDGLPLPDDVEPLSDEEIRRTDMDRLQERKHLGLTVGITTAAYLSSRSL